MLIHDAAAALVVAVVVAAFCLVLMVEEMQHKANRVNDIW